MRRIQMVQGRADGQTKTSIARGENVALLGSTERRLDHTVVFGLLWRYRGMGRSLLSQKSMRRTRMVQAVIARQSITEAIRNEQLSRASVNRELGSDECRHVLKELMNCDQGRVDDLFQKTFRAELAETRGQQNHGIGPDCLYR